MRAAGRNGMLELSIRDDGAGLPEGFDLEQSAGVGLSNTRSRLAQIYGEAAGLFLERRAGGGTVARIQLPSEPPVGGRRAGAGS